MIDWYKKRKAKKRYDDSIEKSLKALNNIEFRNGETPLYFSTTNYELLLDTFNIQPKSSSTDEQNRRTQETTKINGGLNTKNTSLGAGLSSLEEHGSKVTNQYGKDSEISNIKNNIDKIKCNGKTIDKASKGDIFFVHFPVFHGEIAEFKPSNKIKSVYIWYGLYRNIELYLCGSAKNVYTIDNKKYPKSLWAPSSIEGPNNIFETLVSEIVEEGNDISDNLTGGQTIFEILQNNIKDTVMNRYSPNASFLQWQDMIIRCTAVEEKEGIKRIFGFPILVIPSSTFGYGWYNLNHEGRYGESSDVQYHPNNKDTYYEYDDGEFTGNYLEKIGNTGYIDGQPYIKYLNRESDEIDANKAYELYSYKVNKSKNGSKPINRKVKKCDDIIGICIEKNLFIK